MHPQRRHAVAYGAPMDVTAIVTREGRWHVIEVPEIPGLATQAETEDEIVPMVLDAD